MASSKITPLTACERSAVAKVSQSIRAEVQRTRTSMGAPERFTTYPPVVQVGLRGGGLVVATEAKIPKPIATRPRAWSMRTGRTPRPST
jgi:hypothetical protein